MAMVKGPCREWWWVDGGVGRWRGPGEGIGGEAEAWGEVGSTWACGTQHPTFQLLARCRTPSGELGSAGHGEVGSGGEAEA